MLELPLFAPTEVLLDPTNPRFERRAHSQREALNLLFVDGDKMLALARDIVATGALNPTELPVVIEEDGHHVVIEGNRRFACLKALRQPDLVEVEATRAALRQVAAEMGTGPDEVACYFAESRDAAKHWLQLRHTGQNGGVGVDPWNPEQKARFDRKRGTQADRALQFIDGIGEAFATDTEVMSAILTAKQRLTNVGRAIGDPNVRAAFGFDLRKGEVTFHHEREAMRRSLLRLLNDLTEKTVGVFMTRDDRLEYIRTAREGGDLPEVESRLEHPATAADWVDDAVDDNGRLSAGAATVTPLGGAPGKRARVSRPEQYVFESVKPKYLSARFKETLREARRLKIEEYPHTCAVMLRVLLELAVSEAGVSRGWFKDAAGLAAKVAKSVKVLDPDYLSVSKRRPDLHDAYTGSEPSLGGGVVILDLHASIHGIDKLGSPLEVRSNSARFAPLVQAIDDYLGEHPKP